jgi:UDP-GlcNAc:undecaprenyl-phosphate/decaprenyl-phosphate GlcNAc-1-phosphate transferase
MPADLSPVAKIVIFLSAAVGTAALTPLAMRAALHTGLMDLPAAHKIHRRPTPYLGGMAILASVLAAMVGAIVVDPSIRLQYVVIALGATSMAVIGLLDDWLTLGAMPRVAVQVVAALGLWAVGVRLTPVGFVPVDILLTVLLVVAVTNSINLLDNMDGLSTGVVAIASLCLFVVGASQGQHLVDAMALVLGGACLGFLPYNFNPARIFLGDAGTLFMGFILAALVIKVHLDGYALVTRAAVPGLILFVPLFDMTLVVLSRWRGGRAVFLGGTDHSSHRIVSLGYSTRTTALGTYAVAALTAGLGMLLVGAPSPILAWLVTLSVVAGAVLGIRYLEKVHGRMAAVSTTGGPHGSGSVAAAMSHRPNRTRLGRARHTPVGSFAEQP